MVDQQSPPEIDEVEGIGFEDDSTWGDYPLDTVLIRTESRTVHDVLRRINQGQYIMDPDFQRDFIWDDGKQSKLVESVLMRIPLPVFYLAEDMQGRMIVVDGLQRLSTFHRFVEGKLRLRLKDQKELNGKSFNEMAPRLQNRVEDCNLTLYVIDAKAPERARLDIFERVNSGVPLTRQQMRNSLYMGPATRFLKAEASTPLFIDATGKSLRTATMRDREFVNRFCGFQLFDLEEYRGEMDDFLAKTLVHMNSMSEKELLGLSRDFHTALKNNLEVFGRHAFRKHTEFQEHRSVINASLWDVMSAGLSRVDTELVASRAANLRKGFYDLMGNEDFMTAITYGTNDVRRVTERFAATRTMFREVLNA